LRQGQLVPPFLLRTLADLPDEVVAGAKAEPCFEDVAHAVAAMLSEVEPPRALQQKPELHEALLGVVYLYHSFRIQVVKSLMTIHDHDN
jgi:hypothetical protein